MALPLKCYGSGMQWPEKLVIGDVEEGNEEQVLPYTAFNS